VLANGDCAPTIVLWSWMIKKVSQKACKEQRLQLGREERTSGLANSVTSRTKSTLACDALSFSQPRNELVLVKGALTQILLNLNTRRKLEGSRFFSASKGQQRITEKRHHQSPLATPLAMQSGHWGMPLADIRCRSCHSVLIKSLWSIWVTLHMTPFSCRSLGTCAKGPRRKEAAQKARWNMGLKFILEV
jgi:hypothetical protein